MSIYGKVNTPHQFVLTMLQIETLSLKKWHFYTTANADWFHWGLNAIRSHFSLHILDVNYKQRVHRHKVNQQSVVIVSDVSFSLRAESTYVHFFLHRCLESVYCGQIGSMAVGRLNHRTLCQRLENMKIRWYLVSLCFSVFCKCVYIISRIF